jgi:2-oxoglutarate ferredoxin oxidoreductase subunit beta
MNSSNNRTRFNTEAKPNWCPGCGNFGIQSALKKALLELELKPHQVMLASGIGCSGKIAHWVNVYGLHSLHGRTLPIAAGAKLANNELVVIAEGGDGDGFSSGMSHFIHACRRNIDITYIVHNNGVFSLTTGQTSSTGRKGFVSSTTPTGSIEPPFPPTALAISAGATFVARGFSGDIAHLSELIAAGIGHPGFAFIETRQICVTYNPGMGHKWYKERVFKVEDTAHDPSDRAQALSIALGEADEKLATGIFYQTESSPYEKSLPQLEKGILRDQTIANVDVTDLLSGLR